MKNLDKPLASEIVIFGALGDLSRRKLLPSSISIRTRRDY